MLLRSAVFFCIAFAVACGPELSTLGQASQSVGASLSPAPASVAGQNVRCANLRIGAISVANVEIPAGARCELVGTRVTGSLQAGVGAALDAKDLTLIGSLQADQAAATTLTGTSRVSGSVQVVGGGEATITGAAIAGDLQLERLSGAVAIENNQVRGNVQLKENLGAVRSVGNSITGNLQCQDNALPPSVSTTTAASLEGQCAPGAASPGPAAPPPAQPLSGNVTCVGLTIGALILDTVTVPAGASCTLLGTRLTGSLEVGLGASVVADQVNVTGNLVASGAASVQLLGNSQIGGSAQLENGQALSLVGARVAGDVQVSAMSGPVALASLRVGGNMQVMGNLGPTALNANSIAGALQCKGNLVAPIGSGNVASIKEDQCRSL